MHLKELKLSNFKNFASDVFQYHPKLNCIIGQNGVGKTNILDAIHYLCIGKSYFNTIHGQNILHGESSFNITGCYEKNKKQESISLGYEKGKVRMLKRNQKSIPNLSDHIGLFPVVIVTPYDTALVDEGNEERRRFIDLSISQFNNTYLSNLSKYHKLLTQRNKLLKQLALNHSGDTSLLSVLNEQMSELATPIHKDRKKFIDELTPFFNGLYKTISHNAEEVSLTYKSSLEQDSLNTILEQQLQHDLKLTYTTKGIHKDQLTLSMNGYPIKKYGSQGQKKTLIIALKLAKYLLIKEKSKLSPLLLLDDIFDKLDESRVSKIIELISSEDFGQSFITDTNYNQTEKKLSNTEIDFHMIKI